MRLISRVVVVQLAVLLSVFLVIILTASHFDMFLFAFDWILIRILMDRKKCRTYEVMKYMCDELEQ